MLAPLTLLLSAAVSNGAPQAAGLFSAAQLQERCESSTPADASYCYAYIAGVHDTIRAYESWLEVREFCLPRDLVQNDLRHAFMDYISDHPGFRAGAAASVVTVALKTRYPCPNEG